MPRPKIPHFRFFTDDFMEGTRSMRGQEVGDYIRLLCLIYDGDGPVKFDPAALRHALCLHRLSDVVKRVNRLIELGKLWLDENGFLHNGRADRELCKRREWEAENPIQKENSDPSKSGHLADVKASSPRAQPDVPQKTQQNQGAQYTRARDPYPYKKEREEMRVVAPCISTPASPESSPAARHYSPGEIRTLERRFPATPNIERRVSDLVLWAEKQNLRINELKMAIFRRLEKDAGELLLKQWREEAAA